MLLDVEAEHRSHPSPFATPRSEQRRSLHVGQLVKLVTVVDPPAAGGFQV